MLLLRSIRRRFVMIINRKSNVRNVIVSLFKWNWIFTNMWERERWQWDPGRCYLFNIRRTRSLNMSVIRQRQQFFPTILKILAKSGGRRTSLVVLLLIVFYINDVLQSCSILDFHIFYFSFKHFYWFTVIFFC